MDTENSAKAGAFHVEIRASMDVLPVRENLFRRHIIESPICPKCGTEVECVEHALFWCNEIQDFWRNEGFQAVSYEAPTESCHDILLWAFNKMDAEAMRRFLMTMWAIWTILNANLFEEEPCPPTRILTGFPRYLAEYSSYAEKVYEPPAIPRPDSSNSWSPPGEGVIKLNTDAAMFEDGTMGLGVVGRDSNGSVLVVSCKREVKARYVEEAEARAALLGLEIAL
ncbi:uncharacterized protein LOC141628441 [Silene latifolia]|uniref:uncharacterized protein LOC141628441 n=1 Tax=Silene latifolia TaxID=37657 RepID=UPI003D76CCF2